MTHLAPRRAAGLVRSLRLAEPLLMTGFPILGMADAASSPAATASGRPILHAVGLAVLFTAIYAFNTWGGLPHDHLNPRLARQARGLGSTPPSRVLLLAMTLFIGSLMIVSVSAGVRGLVLATAVFSIWCLYSHPGIRGKARPGLGTAVHLAGGLLHHWLGALWAGPVGGQALVVAPFFALVFAAGHMNHELMDREADAAAGLSTTTVVVGAARARHLMAALFAGAYAWLAYLAWSGRATGELTGPFVLAGLGHALGACLMDHTSSTFPLRHRRLYRTLFALAGVTRLASPLLNR